MPTPAPTPPQSQFDVAQQQGAHSLAGELWHFLKSNKKWWLAPMILVLLLMGALVVLGGSAAAPFVYTLF
ncbi:MAG: hypothetical protein HY903_05525 [Deltaproteobacteria bacterium]|nr:hypothetical protein [Deltaproteobacteria bacterium]